MSNQRILNDMLSKVDDTFDKKEGSFFHDIFSPVSFELDKLNQASANILNEAFVTTCTGIYLDSRCLEIGIRRKQATKSTGKVLLKGTLGAKVSKGNLCSSDLVTFEILEDFIIDNMTEIDVECTEFGSVGNVPKGAIKYFPVSILGVSEVVNNQAFAGGYDTESDESLKIRYFEKVSEPSTSGNIFHYKNWAKAVVGVGDAKVFPLWDGPGTVKVLICNDDKLSADEILVSNVQQNIENNRPIGAGVTVLSASEKVINITADIEITGSVSLEDIKQIFQTQVQSYFKEVAFRSMYISISKVGNVLFGMNGIYDYSNLKLNTLDTHITLAEDEVPKLGVVELNVI